MFNLPLSFKGVGFNSWGQEWKKTISQFSITIIVLSSVLTALLGAKILLIPIGLIYLYIAIKRLDIYILFFIALFPLISLEHYGLNRIFLYGNLSIILAIWASRKMLIENERIILSKQLILFFIFTMLATIISNLNNGLTLNEINSIGRFPIFFLFIFIAYDMYEPKHTVLYLIAMSIPMVVDAYFMYKDYSIANNFLNFLYLFRHKPAGFFSTSNILGATIVAVLPFWIVMAILSRRLGIRLLGILMSVILFPTLLMTNARASFIGLIIAAFVIAYWLKKLRLLAVLAIVIIIIILCIPTFRMLIPIAFRFESGLTGRDVIWHNTIDIISKHPIFGVGAGNFPDAYIPYFENASIHYFFRSMYHAHNQILNKTAELGLMGLLLSLILYLLPFRDFNGAIKYWPDKSDKLAIYAIMGGIIALLGASFFEASLVFSGGEFYPEMLFWLLLMMIVKLYEQGSNITIQSFLKVEI